MLKCKNCIHFKPPRYNIDFASSTGTCKKFSKKYGTKLMSLRIAMQSIAILSLVCAYFLWSN